MAKRRRPATWLEVAVARAGMRTAVKAITWAYEWAVTREAVGHEPTADEVAEWWKLSRRTAFREQAAFREAFPELDSPAPIYASAEAREALARLADFGNKVDDWAAERRERRELDALKAVMTPADL